MDNFYEIHDLTKAYLGDAVYSMYVRSYIVKDNKKVRVKDAHPLGTTYEKATSQSKALEYLTEHILTDEEKDIARRAKNKKSQTKAKNATSKEYNNATGLEALVGVLYLNEDFDRLDEIFEIIMRGEYL